MLQSLSMLQVSLKNEGQECTPDVVAVESFEGNLQVSTSQHLNAFISRANLQVSCNMPPRHHAAVKNMVEP